MIMLTYNTALEQKYIAIYIVYLALLVEKLLNSVSIHEDNDAQFERVTFEKRIGFCVLVIWYQ